MTKQFIYGVPSERLKMTLENLKFQNNFVYPDDYEKLDELFKWLKENENQLTKGE